MSRMKAGMTRARRLWAMSVASVVLITASPALAQNTAYLPMGGRTGTMGGTGVAFGDDAAMGLLNPAGLAALDRDTLALSLSVYSLEQTAADDFFAQDNAPDFMGLFTLGGNSLSNTVIRAIPTSLAYYLHYGRAQHHVVGLSVLSPRSIQREFDETLRVDSAATFNRTGAELVDSQATYFIGPSYAVELGFGDLTLRGGASVYLAYSTLTRYLSLDLLAGTVPASSFASAEATRYEDGDSFDLVFAFGAQAKYGIVSIGLSFHPPSAHLGGNLAISATSQSAGNGTLSSPDFIEVTQREGDYTQAFPLRVAAGVAVDLDPFLLALDVTYSAALEFDRFSGQRSASALTEGQNPEIMSESFAEEFRQASVTNVSLGVEAKLGDEMRLRVGGFTDLSATELLPRDEVTVVQLFDERLDRFGVTVGFAALWGGSETAVGLSYVRGVGEMIGWDTGNFEANPSGLRRVDVTVDAFTLSLSGAVDLESLVRG